jgi:hypothetical protein
MFCAARFLTRSTAEMFTSVVVLHHSCFLSLCLNKSWNNAKTVCGIRVLQTKYPWVEASCLDMLQELHWWRPFIVSRKSLFTRMYPFYDLFNKAISSSGYIKSKDIWNNGWTGKDTVVAYFQVQPMHFPAGTRKTPKISVKRTGHWAEVSTRDPRIKK